MQAVVFTASEMAALLWQTQENPEDVGEYAANQQQRALSSIVMDVLAVFAGLEHVRTETKDDGYAASTFSSLTTLLNYPFLACSAYIP